MFGTIELKLRPLRLAFLVDPRSNAALREAIEINSTLWGGIYTGISGFWASQHDSLYIHSLPFDLHFSPALRLRRHQGP